MSDNAEWVPLGRAQQAEALVLHYRAALTTIANLGTVLTAHAAGELAREALEVQPDLALHAEARHPLLSDVALELERAQRQHPPLHSHHEAYAVLMEELDEYKAEVWKRRSERDPARIQVELVQLAAMAVRAIEDLRR